MDLIPTPPPIARELSPAFVAKLDSLDPLVREAFLNEYTRRRKSIYAAFIFHGLACHYLYLGKFGIQMLYWMSMAGLGFWWLVDFFRLRGMVRDRNRAVALSVLSDVQVLRT